MIEVENQYTHATSNSTSFGCSSSSSSSGNSSSSTISSMHRTTSSASVCSQQTITTIPVASNDTTFIDNEDLERLINEKEQKCILIDCRVFKDYEIKHIQNSIHINCRDKITKNRLSKKKLNVRDIVSCEKTKKKLDDCLNLICPSTSSSILNNENLIIILYDEATKDNNDLLMDWNPLKIVLDNLLNTFKNNKCRILKGGFSEFSTKYPHLCVSQENDENKIKICERLLAARQQYGEDQRKDSIENAKMTKINSYLYLGNECDAKNLNNLMNEGVHYILNVTKNIPCYHENDTNNKINYKRIAVNDACNQNLKQFFDEAFEFIDEAKKNESKVLVHCQAGVSRSPTIVIAYLMKTLNLKMSDALNKVKEQRTIVDPNLVFMNQLIDYETDLANKTALFVQNKITRSTSNISLVNATTTTTTTNNNNNTSTTTLHSITTTSTTTCSSSHNK